MIYLEKVSGKSIRNRLELEKAIDHLDTGDTRVIAERDRATRSMIEYYQVDQQPWIAALGAGQALSGAGCCALPPSWQHACSEAG